MREKKIKIISDIAKPYNKRFPGPFKPWSRQWDQKNESTIFRSLTVESHTVELFLNNSSQVKRIDPKTLFELSWCLYSAFLSPQQKQQQQHKQQCWQQQQQQQQQQHQQQLQMQSSSWTLSLMIFYRQKARNQVNCAPAQKTK